MNHLILEWHTDGVPDKNCTIIYKTVNNKFIVGYYHPETDNFFSIDKGEFYRGKCEIEGWAYLTKDNPIIMHNMTAQGTDNEDNTIMMVNGYVGIGTIAINPPSKMYVEVEKENK